MCQCERHPNPWAKNPAAITVQDLLHLALDMLERMPPDSDPFEREPMHPHDAHSAVRTLIDHAAAARMVEWDRHRPARD